jgi:phenylacetate-coenzyme A ligase PaaK-like adenylate-forming protein
LILSTALTPKRPFLLPVSEKPTSQEIFSINSPESFEETALAVFRYQAKACRVYSDFVRHLGIDPETIRKVAEIPFLPVSFFKTHQVICEEAQAEIVFSSSGTTGMAASQHHVRYREMYEKSFMESFRRSYGEPADYSFLALLPSYLERSGSSLIYMVEHLMKESKQQGGFFLHEHESLATLLRANDKAGKKTILIGVSYALLDLLETERFSLKNAIILETGGMKGRRKELIREELHDQLRDGFGVEHIHSEYGMTELLSQAYSKGEGIFTCPPWMQIVCRETDDPFSLAGDGRTGGINIIDLANLESCSFIATADLGRTSGTTFEVLGRFDHSDLRGCNLLVV